MNWKQWLLDILYPPKCPFCGKLLSDTADSYCSDCERSLPRTREGTRVKVDFMTWVISPLYYEKQVRQSFLRYKFHGMRVYSTAYSVLLAECVKREMLDPWDCITWVPLSRRRLRKRGYDQARLLAEKTAARLGIPVVSTLKKVRDTKAQSSLTTAEERRGNISGCYAVTDASVISGKRILLMDDILTTGATMSECARVLLLAGAESVYGAAFARKRNES